MISDNNVLVFEPQECETHKMPQIEQTIHKYFHQYRGHNEKTPYWISFDIDSLDASAFKSTGTAEGGGLSMDFVKRLFEVYASKSIGMDLSEVNFELTNGQARQTDE